MSIKDFISFKNMSTKDSTELQNDKLTRPYLNSLKRDEIRHVASVLGISKLRSFNKSELAEIILNKQAQMLREPKDNATVQQLEDTHSDLSDLKETSKFNGKVKTFHFVPTNNQSLADLVEYLYPKLTFLSGQASCKVSIDLKVTFQSPRFAQSQFFIQSKRYTRFEDNKRLKILNDFEKSISNKDTEASGWTVVSIDEVYLNISKSSMLSKGP